MGWITWWSNQRYWLDWTYFQTDIPSRQIATLIAHEADRFRNLTFETERFEREKKVILGERREQVDGDPDTLLSEYLWRKCKANSRYERPTIGYEDEIKELASGDLFEIYRESYHNRNLVICVCGQFDADEVRAAIQTEFEMQSVPIELQVATSDKSHQHFRTGFLGQLSLPLLNERLLIALPTPSVDTRTFAALEIVHQVLFEGESASVHRDLVVEQEIASHVSGFLPGLEEEGLYEISIEMLEPNSEAQFIEYLGSVLDQIAKTGLTPSELNRCRNRAELEALECLQTADQRAYQFGFWETVTGHCNALQVRLNQYAELTNEDIRSAVQTWWSRENLAWVIGRRTHD